MDENRERVNYKYSTTHVAAMALYKYSNRYWRCASDLCPCEPKRSCAGCHKYWSDKPWTQIETKGEAEEE